MIGNMKHLMRSSGVCRAPVAKLRQDRLSRSGVESKLSRCNAARSKIYLSWYVALNSKKPSEEKASGIPQIKWKCPPKFALNASWVVAAGEGSEEAATQKHRETTVLEVVYPDLTSIPPCPSVSAYLGNECSDDSRTPIIPLIPIEEVDAATPSDTSDSEKVQSAPENLSVSQPDPSGPQDQTVPDSSLVKLLHGLERTDLEAAVAAAATVAAVLEKKEQIDTQLLIKFLTDPEMVKKLLDENWPISKPEKAAPPAPSPTGNATPPAPSPTENPTPPAPNPTEDPTPPVPDPNTSLPLPAPKPVSEYSEPVKKSSPLPRSGPCHPPVRNLTREPIIKQVRPLMPYTWRPDAEMDRLVNKYLAPDIARVTPIAPLNTCTSNPNIESAKRMIHEYGAPGAPLIGKPMNGYGVEPFVGPSPLSAPLPPVINHPMNGYGVEPFVGPSPLPAPLPPVINHALGSGYTAPGNFHAPNFYTVPTHAPNVGFNHYAPLTPAPNVGFNHYKTLIEQHGQMHEMGEQKFPIIGQPGNNLQGFKMGHNNMSSIVTNPKFSKPCMYFSSSNGCRNGSNCQYRHDIGATEFPEAKRMKFTR